MTTAATLAAFAIVHTPGPEFPDSETESLFSFPPQLTVDEVQRLAGLAQGINSLASAFAPGKQVRLVKSLKHRLAIAQPEPGFWILLLGRCLSRIDVSHSLPTRKLDWGLLLQNRQRILQREKQPLFNIFPLQFMTMR
ncbi:hypothetical protein BDR26DRAFT_906169 [Obelidium mucronatum]|nr:hypothetical protein BDR26DRAFT_906169 [Obelidium mucronatum]